PFHPYVNLSLATSIIAGITGSGGGGTEVAASILAEPFLAMNLNNEFLHRLLGISALGLSCLPHNGMINTLFHVCGVTYKEGYKYLFFSTVVNSIICMLVCIFLGVFVIN